MRPNSNWILPLLSIVYFTHCTVQPEPPALRLQNADFEQACSVLDTAICGWQIAWKSSGIDPQLVASPHGQSLRVESTKGEAVFYFEQKIELSPPFELSIVELQARAHTEQLKGQGLGIIITVEDGEGQHLYTENMRNSMLSGNQDWQTLLIQAYLTKAARVLKIGGIAYGEGISWFDDFVVSISPIAEREGSTLARSYFDSVGAIIAQHSIRKDSIDLENIKDRALRLAGQANDTKACYLALNYLLAQLGDHHSFFMRPEEVELFENGDESDLMITYPNSRLLENAYAYIKIPGMRSGSDALMTAFADTIQTAIRNFDRLPLKGWIVDLREDVGGNMHPMLAGIGPLFDADTLGSLQDVYGQDHFWMYRDGASVSAEGIDCQATDPVKLRPRQLPIAVLVGPNTGSSGEAVTISFIGNDRTRLFGEPTWGLSTGNDEFDLPDGARLFLTSTVMVDRNGKRYGGPIQPDTLVLADPERKGDEVIEVAMRWIDSAK